MVNINEEALSEYQSLLDQLAGEFETLDLESKLIAKRMKAIKAQVAGIADNLGGTDRRVVLVQTTQAGVDLVNHIETDLMKESAPGYAMLTQEEVITFEKLTKRMFEVVIK